MKPNLIILRYRDSGDFRWCAPWDSDNGNLGSVRYVSVERAIAVAVALWRQRVEALG